MRAIMAILLLAFLLPKAEAADRGPPRTPRLFRAKEVLVKYRASVAKAGRHRALARARGAKVLGALSSEGLLRLQVPAGESVANAVKDFAGSEGVEFAQPNYIYRKSALPNDALYAQQWHLKNAAYAGKDIGAETAWNTITDCGTVPIAVVDTGINYTHEDLTGNMWSGIGYDFVDLDADPQDLDGHGTHVAGLIAAQANNSVGTSGVCWRAKLMAVRVLDASGSGFSSDIAAGINYAVTNGAKIINLSLGQYQNDSALSVAVTNATNAGVIVVAAAGNDGSNNDSTPIYPCNLTNGNVICVAALKQDYTLASFSNYGATTVDIAAPGNDIQSLGAGVVTTQSDSFAGWTYSGSGWGTKTVGAGGSTYASLVNPANWNRSSAYYANSSDARAYKSFNLNGADAATLSVYAALDVSAGDAFSVAYRTSAGDPFSSGTELENTSGSTNNFYESYSYDLTNCRVSPCSVGFRLSTNSTGVNYGVSLIDFELNSLTLTTNAYEKMSGTSMATPIVTGIVALVRAYNPAYTADDVVAAVKNGGVAVPGLSGKVSTGRAASASGALQYIATPAGLSASLN